ncbi:hypothetical protein CPIN18021_0276 [Campylobacter pinnipediorum subsp. caledonicus]|uniref:Uncharacterized protein n=1 Tax=Campylobacter pinnipediorum subsp. caledonicus TaxID=1874362 RepID=A0A1S6U5Y3_9BACT|nr:hypothetical protein [Campylobacter pinnipediorum]AQW87123.1 hypothetical protein CPIN18021_0276 [Campylobacter pinnipediorum subsp. caledonicus]
MNDYKDILVTWYSPKYNNGYKVVIRVKDEFLKENYMYYKEPDILKKYREVLNDDSAVVLFVEDEVYFIEV